VGELSYRHLSARMTPLRTDDFLSVRRTRFGHTRGLSGSFNGGVAMRAFGLAGKSLSDETTNLKAHRT